MPFYKRLADLNDAHRLHGQLLAVMPDDAVAGAAELKSQQIHMYALFSKPLSSIRVTATPTLLLVDGMGRIDKAWVGELPPAQESEVVSILEK